MPLAKLEANSLLCRRGCSHFRPEQQRQFFTLFRDLRSPFITCNAAVYPGVTAYGQTFQAGHDALIEQINRDVLDKDGLTNMREIVFKQADSALMVDITTHGENFTALAYAVSGNPRLLLKTIARAGRLRTTDVEKVLKEFYRSEVWSEHSGLAERYAGHRGLIDWADSLSRIRRYRMRGEERKSRECLGKLRRQHSLDSPRCAGNRQGSSSIAHIYRHCFASRHMGSRNPQRNRDEVFYQLGLPSGKRGKADLIFGSNRKRPFDKKIQ